MKIIPITLSFLAITMVPLSSVKGLAQDVPDIQARRDSIVNVELHIEQREQRIDDLTTDIRSMDDRLEQRIDKVLETVGKYKDSNESRTRVAQLKADLIVGLKRTVEYYKARQNEVREQLRLDNPAIKRETLQQIDGVFQDRIEKRVEQVLKLANTFTDPEELEKYETTSRSSYDGWGWGWNANVEISEDWKHNRIESRHTDSTRKDVITALQGSIDYLSRSNDYLKEKLKEKSLSEAESSLYESELKRNAALIQQRESQLERFIDTPTPETESLDRNSAHGMEELIRDAVSDMRQDFFAIFQKYEELNKERADLNSLQENLAARVAWLEDYDAKNPK